MKIAPLLLLATLAAAHPGGEPHEDAATRLAKRKHHTKVSRDLESCSGLYRRNGLNDRAAARRAATIEEYRRKNKHYMGLAYENISASGPNAGASFLRQRLP